MHNPQNQNAWKLPAVLNLTLGGMGAGYYLISLLMINVSNTVWLPFTLQTILVKLIGIILVCVGLLVLTTEAGHPLKSIYLLANLRQSWMSREALAAMIFILAAGLDWLFPSAIFQVLAAIAGLVFMVSQGMIVWRASSVYTWNSPLVPWFFLTCGLTSGSGLLLVVSNLLNLAFSSVILAIILIVLLFNLLIWILYLRTPGDTFQRGIAPLRKSDQLRLTIGVGHLLPALLLIIGMIGTQWWIAFLAGGLMVFGSVLQKFSFAFKGSSMRSVLKP